MSISTMVVTNVVAALAITTTRTVPCPCPDKIPGCCVLHTQEISETRYEPIKIGQYEVLVPGTSPIQRGVAIKYDDVKAAMDFAFADGRVPLVLPVGTFTEDANGNTRTGLEIIGFIIGAEWQKIVDDNTTVYVTNRAGRAK